MTGSEKVPAGAVLERTLARRWSPWQDALGLFLALAAALALWVVMLGGVAAPLGDSLARLEATKAAETPACPAPPEAVASAALPTLDETCR